MRGNNIGAEGTKALAENKILTSLNVGGNNIGVEGAKALADNKTLTSLNVSYNDIGAAGAKALADNKTLKSLNVCFNGIGDEGAKALADNKTLTSLAVNDCNISKEIKQVIEERIQLNINNIAQYKNECRTIASLLRESNSFFNTNHLPKDMTHVILQKLSDAYELPYDEHTVNKIMSSS